MKESITLSIISFTEKGMALSQRVAALLQGGNENGNADAASITCHLFTRHSAASASMPQQVSVSISQRISASEPQQANAPVPEQVSSSVSQWAGERMRRREALLFIGACGIAVRAVAPHLADKLTDSPVLVMDELGRHVIPILSGHVGGANGLALLLAELLGAEPVITTATDLNGCFAADLFARKNGLFIVNREGIARVSSRALAGEEITVSVEEGHLEPGTCPPEGVRLVPWPPEEYVDVTVSTKQPPCGSALLLFPREYVLGMGCRKAKEAEAIAAFIRRETEALGLRTEQLAALATITVKQREPGLLSWCRRERVPLLAYSAGELLQVEGSFHTSDFVKKQVGVDNVCERAALRACGPGGTLILEKCAQDGMTLAIAKKEWRVSF